jgi:hypothetical protein
MKRKTKPITHIDDLAALAKLAQTEEWKIYSRMVSNRIAYQKDHIVALPEKNPYLGIDKAYDRGIIAGLLIGVKAVETAASEMEKLAQKEAE